jgi:fructose-1,6-bisphosphatase I
MTSTAPGTTLADWLAAQDLRPGLADTVTAIAAACAEISAALRTAPLTGLTGVAGSTNVQGEAQKPLDILSNDLFIKHLAKVPRISSLISEELNQAHHFPIQDDTADLIVACDPLDGSSNIDVNVTVGSVFSILAGGRDALLQPGTAQLAAGYTTYGGSTNLVLTFGKSVALFTLDTDDVFRLADPAITVPVETAEYAINSARQPYWDAATTRYVEGCLAGEAGPFGKRYNMRWVGSMVADVHRILMRGGVFLYPLDSETAAKGGRLRLVYEAFPMAMIVEAAGGAAITGPQRILDIAPREIHQRVAVILGSKAEVERIAKLYAEAG